MPLLLAGPSRFEVLGASRIVGGGSSLLVGARALVLILTASRPVASGGFHALSGLAKIRRQRGCLPRGCRCPCQRTVVSELTSLCSDSSPAARSCSPVSSARA